MKKNIASMVAILALSVSASAFAATTGGYVGLGLGTSKIQTGKSNQFVSQEGFSFYPPGSIRTNPINLAVATKQKKELGGLGGRIFAGYNFNQNLGLEVGYAKYANSKYSASAAGFNSASIDHKLSAVDLVAKGYIPLGSNFNVYGLAGAAYVNHTVDYKPGNISLADGVTAKAGSTKTHKIRPKYGVGVSYDIPEAHITTALELSRIQGSGNAKKNANALPSSDMLALTVAYNFG